MEPIKIKTSAQDITLHELAGNIHITQGSYEDRDDVIVCTKQAALTLSTELYRNLVEWKPVYECPKGLPVWFKDESGEMAAGYIEPDGTRNVNQHIGFITHYTPIIRPK